MPGRKVEIACSECSSVLLRRACDIKRAIDTMGKYTCKPCTLKTRNAEMARSVGETRTTKKGYIEIKTEAGWRFQHIEVMESHLERTLAPGERVHHGNEIKSDNRIENLELMEHGEHTAHHHAGQRRSIKTRTLIAVRARARSKLTEQAVKEIRDLVASGTMSRRRAAKRFGVSPMTVSRIANNQTWSL